MNLISLVCTNCGAKLDVNSELKRCICQYCGNEMPIDNGVQRYEHTMTNGFDFGYQQELGRQQAYYQQQMMMQNDHYRLISTPTAVRTRFSMQKTTGWTITEYDLDALMRR